MSVYYIEHTAEEYREMAAAANKRSRESFERCDTDGFLSQWASDFTASVYRFLASIAEDEGKAWIVKLCSLETGEPVNAKIIDGRFGACWMLLDEQNRSTGEFAPYAPKRKSTLEKRGYCEKEFFVKVKVIVTSGSNFFPRFNLVEIEEDR